jgi:DNA-binding NarL/FixJ family response regulator
VCKVASLVMIVDDHAVIRRMVRALLEAESLVVSDAVDGAESVQKARAEKPDLITRSAIVRSYDLTSPRGERSGLTLFCGSDTIE